MVNYVIMFYYCQCNSNAGRYNNNYVNNNAYVINVCVTHLV